MPAKKPETPEQTERRTKSWPISKLCMTFEEADETERALQNRHFKTARINWSGRYLEVRAKRMTKREVEKAFFGDVLGED